MLDVFFYLHKKKKKNKFACKGICVFYKNRIRGTKVQTTKEENDALYLAHEKKREKIDNKVDNTKLETLHAKKKKNQGIIN